MNNFFINKKIINNHTIGATIFIFIIIYMIFITMRPSFLFTKDGAIRHFGLGKRDSTIIPIWLFVIILAILIYMIILCYVR